MVISIYVFSFWGEPPDPTRPLPLDPAGGLLFPVPLFCPPSKQISGYASEFSASASTSSPLASRFHGPRHCGVRIGPIRRLIWPWPGGIRIKTDNRWHFWPISHVTHESCMTNWPSLLLHTCFTAVTGFDNDVHKSWRPTWWSLSNDVKWA